MNFWKKLLAAATAGMLCLGSVAIANRTNGNVTMHTAADEPAEGAYDGMYGDLYYQINADNEIAIVGCEANATSAIIPEKIGGKSVTRIEAYTFDSYANLKSVSIPSSMKVIEDMAFYRCVNLNRVYISDLSSWCSIDFANATSNPLCNGAELYVDGEWIDQLTLPDDVTEINDFAFCGFSGLKQIKIPNGVTSIGDYAFKDCSGLTAVELPQGVERIGRDAFLSCIGLTKMVIPNSVNDIGRDAFGDCSALTIYGNSGSYAQEYAERYDIPFVSVAGETTTTAITTNTTVTFTESSTAPPISHFELSNEPPIYYGDRNGADEWDDGEKIVDGIFVRLCDKDAVTAEINSYAELYHSDGVCYEIDVMGILENAFQGCTELTALTIPESVTEIPENAFEDCPNLTIYGASGSYAQKYAESHNISFVATSSQVTTTTTETTTTMITTVTTTITCPLPDHFELSDDPPIYYGDHNGDFEWYGEYGIHNIGDMFVRNCAKGASYAEIASEVYVYDNYRYSYRFDVVGILENAFQGCTYLTELRIPESVTEIPENAFEDCPNLTIYGNAGSYAQEYAEKYGIPFVFAAGETTTAITTTTVSTTTTTRTTTTTTTATTSATTTTRARFTKNTAKFTTTAKITTTASSDTTTSTTTTTTTTTTKATASESAIMYGDINLDGRVDITDAVLLNKYCSGSVSLNKDAAKNADCDGDKEISNRDAISLLKFLVQLIPALPESE